MGSHPCLYCGEETKNPKFCSNKCHGKFIRITQSNSPPSSEKRFCLNCGKETKNAKFCSNKCNGAYQKIHYVRMSNFEMRLCDHCGVEFKPINSNNRFCCAECLKAEQNKGHRTIWVRDGFKCIYCGQSSIEDGVRLTLDHITPRDAGGKDTASNLVTACWDCNSSKNASLLPNKIYKRIVRLVKRRNKAAGISNTQKINALGWKIGFKHRKNETE